jgi:hypothetical protein
LTFRQRYDVEVVTTSFEMPLWEALALVHSSDVFLGMHGAGFANLLGLHKVNPWHCNLSVPLLRRSLRMEAEREQCSVITGQRSYPCLSLSLCSIV